MNNDEQRITNKLAELTAEATQMGIQTLFKNNGPDSSTAVHVGCTTALSAFQVIAPFVAKRGHVKNAKEAVALINRDTLLFVALVTARMQEDMQPLKERDGGVEIECTARFGPLALFEALQDWEKVTGKNPDEILDPKMLEAAREAGAKAERAKVPFDDFLQKRAMSPSSQTLN